MVKFKLLLKNARKKQMGGISSLLLSVLLSKPVCKKYLISVSGLLKGYDASAR